eukprot:480370_1
MSFDGKSKRLNVKLLCLIINAITLSLEIISIIDIVHSTQKPTMIRCVLICGAFIVNVTATVKVIKDISNEKFIVLWFENLLYDKLFSFYNKPAPLNICVLNEKSTNKHQCAICLEPFNTLLYGIECILKCGHKYHKTCLRKWELSQINIHMNPINGHKCALCKTSYSFMNKWHCSSNTKVSSDDQMRYKSYNTKLVPVEMKATNTYLHDYALYYGLNDMYLVKYVKSHYWKLLKSLQLFCALAKHVINKCISN